MTRLASTLKDHAVLQDDDGRVTSLVTEALEEVQQGNQELRELVHGILPTALTRGGLRAAVNAIVKRLDLPADVEIPDERFPAEIEASAYFVMAEALTNISKHADAARAEGIDVLSVVRRALEKT